MKNNPIGVFDSGYGGLTILKELMSVLPEYDFLYLGDNARSPYGTRSFNVVHEYTLQAVKELFSRGCQLVILACNTASAKALRNIQQKYLPENAPTHRVLGVIRPSIEYISANTKTGHVGVLATSGTVASDSYPIEFNKWSNGKVVQTTQEACPMWVPIVENNEINSDGAEYFIKKNIKNILEKDNLIDHIVLACTHYPLLINTISKYIDDNKIKIVSQGDVVAKSLKDYLKRHPEIEQNCSKNSLVEYLTTEQSNLFNSRAKQFLGIDIKAKSIHL